MTGFPYSSFPTWHINCQRYSGVGPQIPPDLSRNLAKQLRFLIGKSARLGTAAVEIRLYSETVSCKAAGAASRHFPEAHFQK